MNNDVSLKRSGLFLTLVIAPVIECDFRSEFTLLLFSKPRTNGPPLPPL